MNDNEKNVKECVAYLVSYCKEHTYCSDGCPFYKKGARCEVERPYTWRVSEEEENVR